MVKVNNMNSAYFKIVTCILKQKGQSHLYMENYNKCSRHLLRSLKKFLS